MAFSTADVSLITMQNILSTSVGVAFAYPILSQIIDIKNEKILKECDRVIKIIHTKGDQIGFLDLASDQIEFKHYAFRSSKVASYLTGFSALVGTIAFFVLFLSTINQKLSLSFVEATLFSLLLSSPFFLAGLQLIRWWDGYAKFSTAIGYYRGDNM
ncbi:hypothetical protein [Agrobacterium sp. P15N1-A]|uniref:hypothetical protein n=1 Tax=Agrobacterium sp. P15N1-A TaxID=3342820 RepID=UPI0037D2FE24